MCTIPTPVTASVCPGAFCGMTVGEMNGRALFAMRACTIQRAVFTVFRTIAEHVHDNSNIQGG